MPKTLVAGDSWALDWTNPAWPDQPDRLVELVFGSGEVRLKAVGAAIVQIQTTWFFHFPANDTAPLKPALYQWYVVVTDGVPPDVARATPEVGKTIVIANPAGTAPIEPKSLLRLTLEAAKLTRFKLVSGETSTVQFQGHAYTLWDLQKLQDLIRELEHELEVEEAPTGRSRKLMYTRFRKI